MLTSCGPLQSFLSVTVCKNRTAPDGVGTYGSLLYYNGMTSRLSCCGDSVLQMLAQNKAIVSWCGDSGTTTARAIVGGVTSIFQTVDCPDVNVCICDDLRTLSCS